MSLDLPANALGIDFGTSNSTVGWLRPGAPTLLPLEEGKITLPSVLFFNYEERHSVFGRLQRQGQPRTGRQQQTSRQHHCRLLRLRRYRSIPRV